MANIRDRSLPEGINLKQTLGSKRIDLHYAKLNIPRRWTWDRFELLCSVLRVTHREMASVLCLPPHAIKHAYFANCFSGPAALLLTLIEANVMKGITDTIENPLASLSSPDDRPQDS